MAAIKMKILAVLLFLFQNLMVPISMKYIDKVQKMLNDFFWQNKGARIKMLHQKVCNGGIAFPCLRKYYQASRLVAMREWWRIENQDVWTFEQYGVLLPLKEWALTVSGLRPTITSHNSIFRTIMGIWRSCQKLSPIQSPLPSFIYSPGFKEPLNIFTFEMWRQAGMDKLGKLGSSVCVCV